MSVSASSDHPIEDLIRKNLNIAAMFVRAAKNQRWTAGAEVAAGNARQAYERAMELVRTLADEHRPHWQVQLIALQTAINSVESGTVVPTPEQY